MEIKHTHPLAECSQYLISIFATHPVDDIFINPTLPLIDMKCHCNECLKSKAMFDYIGINIIEGKALVTKSVVKFPIQNQG